MFSRRSFGSTCSSCTATGPSDLFQPLLRPHLLQFWPEQLLLRSPGRVALIGAGYELTSVTFWGRVESRVSHCDGDAASQSPAADHVVPESKERKGGREPLGGCVHDSRHFFCHGPLSTRWACECMRERASERVAFAARGVVRGASATPPSPFLRKAKSLEMGKKEWRTKHQNLLRTAEESPADLRRHGMEGSCLFKQK